MKIPFIGGSYSGRSKNINSQRSVNFFVVIDKEEAKDEIALYGTPGLVEYATLEDISGDSCVRAVHQLRSTIIAVCGDRVYLVPWLGATPTPIGTIGTTTGNIFIDDNGAQVMIVDGAGGYYVSGGTLYTITDLDFPVPDSVTFLDGYFIITEKDTGKIYISGLYDASVWDALDFASAEANPDYALRVLAVNRELFVFGEKTTEPFYNSGDADFPFDRVNGGVMPVGTAAPASAISILGQSYWLSNTLQVVRNSGYQPQVISTPTIDYQISKYSVTSDARAYTCSVDGHQWYVLIFPTEKHTWVFDITTNYWFELESYNTGDDSTPFSRHRSNCCVRVGNKEVVGDYENGKLYYLDMDTYTDNLNTIRRIRASQYISKDRGNVIWNSFELDIEAGVGLDESLQGSDPQICLDWSSDGGHTWSNEYWESAGKMGEYLARAIWRRLGKSRTRIVRVTVSDPVKWVILGAYADLEALS